MKILFQLSIILALCSFQAISSRALSDGELELETTTISNTTSGLLSTVISKTVGLLTTFLSIKDTSATHSFFVEVHPTINPQKRLTTHQIGVRISNATADNFTENTNTTLRRHRRYYRNTYEDTTTTAPNARESITRTDTPIEMIYFSILIVYFFKFFIILMPFLWDYCSACWMKCLIVVFCMSYFIFGYGILGYFGIGRKQLVAFLVQDFFEIYSYMSFLRHKNLPLFEKKERKVSVLCHIWYFTIAAKIISMYYILFRKAGDFNTTYFPLDSNYLGSLLVFMAINTYRRRNPCSTQQCIHDLSDIAVFAMLAFTFFVTLLKTWDTGFFVCTFVYNFAYLVFRFYIRKMPCRPTFSNTASDRVSVGTPDSASESASDSDSSSDSENDFDNDSVEEM